MFFDFSKSLFKSNRLQICKKMSSKQPSSPVYDYSKTFNMISRRPGMRIMQNGHVGVSLDRNSVPMNDRQIRDIRSDRTLPDNSDAANKRYYSIGRTTQGNSFKRPSEDPRRSKPKEQPSYRSTYTPADYTNTPSRNYTPRRFQHARPSSSKENARGTPSSINLLDGNQYTKTRDTFPLENANKIGFDIRGRLTYDVRSSFYEPEKAALADQQKDRSLYNKGSFGGKNRKFRNFENPDQPSGVDRFSNARESPKFKMDRIFNGSDRKKNPSSRYNYVSSSEKKNNASKFETDDYKQRELIQGILDKYKEDSVTFHSHQNVYEKKRTPTSKSSRSPFQNNSPFFGKPIALSSEEEQSLFYSKRPNSYILSHEMQNKERSVPLLQTIGKYAKDVISTPVDFKTVPKCAEKSKEIVHQYLTSTDDTPNFEEQVKQDREYQKNVRDYRNKDSVQKLDDCLIHPGEKEPPKHGFGIEKPCNTTPSRELWIINEYYMKDLKKALSIEKPTDYFLKLFVEHFKQLHQTFSAFRNDEIILDDEINSRLVYLPPTNKKTLVFDLDETLIHCTDASGLQGEVQVSFTMPNTGSMTANINIRPYARQCLLELSQQYQVVIFTASHQAYADAVLDILDPKHEYIVHRLFREHCIMTPRGVYVKDLRIFANRGPEEIILIDNSPHCYVFNKFNGVPIIPFYDNYSDFELLRLISFLRDIAKVSDVRSSINKFFKIAEIVENLEKYDAAVNAILK